MSLVEGGRKLEDFGEKPVTEDLSGFFNEGEVAVQDEKGRVKIVKQAGEHQSSEELKPEILANAGHQELPANKEVAEDSTGLAREEIDAFMKEVAMEQRSRKLTPEIVRSAWRTLNHYERRFVNVPQSQFDDFIDKYEATHGSFRKNLITGLRKLTESRNQLTAGIMPELQWERDKPKEKKEKKAA